MNALLSNILLALAWEAMNGEFTLADFETGDERSLPLPGQACVQADEWLKKSADGLRWLFDG